MTTTPETPEQICAEGMHDLTYRGKQVTPSHARALADYGVSRLRAAGLLGGDPTEGQIERPEVIVICGSTRFRKEIADANRDLTLAGSIVLAPGVFGHSGDAMTDVQKVELDRLHFRKIDMADRVVVVAPGGYIGSSTSREVTYAKERGVPVEVRDSIAAAGVAPQDPSLVASAPTVGDDGGHGRDDDRGGREDGPEDEGCIHRSTVSVTPQPSGCSNPECPLGRAHSGPCAPEGWSPDREKLASRLRGDILDAVPDNNDMQHILEMAAAAFAAPPVVDEEKLAEEISRHKLVHVSVSRKSAFCRCNSSVKSGTDDNLAWFEAHRARAVIEWWEKQR